MGPGFFSKKLRRLWRKGLWSPGDGAPGQGGALLTAGRVAILTLEQFQANRLSIHASGLSFFMLLSLVPLLAFLFLILKVFDVAARVKPFLLDLVTGGNTLLVERISEYIESTRSLGLGGFGFLTLFLIGYLVLQRVKNTLNTIWRVGHRPGYRYRFIEYVTILAVMPLLLVASFSFSAVLRGLHQSAALEDWALLNNLSLTLAPFSDYLVLWLVVYYAYGFLPDTKVRWRAALVGTVFAGTGLAVAQNFYILVIVRVSNYNLVYGALALLPFLMVWFYVAWTIFLFGAQLCCITQHYTLFLDQRLHVGRRLGSTTPYFALLTLAGLLRLMGRTGGAPHIREIQKTTELPRGVVEESLNQLVAAGLLTPVAHEEERFVPRIVLEKFTVREVLARLDVLPGFRKPAPGWRHPGGEGLREIFRRGNEALEAPLRKLTLGKLLETMEPAGRAGSPPPTTAGAGSGEAAYLPERGAPGRAGRTKALLRKK